MSDNNHSIEEQQLFLPLTRIAPISIPLSIPLTVAEYFAGIGLVRIGLENAGWEVAFANDFSHQKYQMYSAYFKDAESHYVVEDIFNIDPSKVPFTTLATSSFPCIDLSLAGNMEGIQGKHSSAFWGFINVLKKQGKFSPPVILVENVQGWLYSNKGKDFRLTVQALNEIGYFCDVFILDALRFIPQSRPRVFLAGSKFPPNKDGASKILKRTKSLSSSGLRKAISDNLYLNWMYLELPEPPSRLNYGMTRKVVEVMTDDDHRWWPEEKVEKHIQMMDASHRKRVDALRTNDTISYRTFYRRIRSGQQRVEVRSDDIAGCLRTAVGGSSRQFLIAAGKNKIRMRMMTPREYARLQGVPDEYPIEVDENQALTGFGDAVCVPAITWIAEHALNPLAANLALINPLPPNILVQLQSR